MAEKREKLPEFTTPIGVFKFPKLIEPDYGTDKYPKENGEYSTRIIFPADDKDVKAFLAKVQPLYEAAIKSAEERFSNLPVASRKKLKKIAPNEFWQPVYDKETEEPTGEIEFKASTPFSGEYKKGPKAGQKWERTLVLFDAHGKRIKGLKSIWGGTRGRLRVSVYPYFIAATGACGVGFRLVGAQIIELVEGGGRSAESCGFDEVEDGYSFNESDVFEQSPGTDAEGDGGDF